ncbi:hypothetical protein M422DRAFT_260402 [Sphaerobolus stellatus SS14]|uniref:Unplaced genomic scaffold SPHSTscaffold_228, whole genome shotgun sequence n=1 Tax=Sphaerobolus stellatus (strain SS14) TaxID=990650 RepID=A0A0C9TGL8_SPHS4|nr:hypothetical protein M422DRAFT_270171 [Sphaerobolus stellatus SS14]KIJ37019.1 hypothetical protein M422DRAFT_260402 [Sphaerobolus stellatus SS14]
MTMPSQKLSPDARRIRTIIVALPIAAVTAYVLYKRLVLEEPQRKLAGPGAHGPLIPMRKIGTPEQAESLPQNDSDSQ